MNVSRRAVWCTLAVAALMVLLGAWFVSSHDREFYEDRGRPKPPALKNSWLALEMLLARFGYRVTTSREAMALDQLPAGSTVIMSSERQYHLTPSRTASLLAWVGEGGLLIADAAGVGREDPILQAFDVRFTPARGQGAAPAADEEEEDDDAKAEAVRTKRRELPLRVVDVPGYGRELRMRSGNASLYPGNVAPAWQVAGNADKRGRTAFEILAYDHGAGRVVLVNGLWRFAYHGVIARDDHAEIILAIVATHQRDGEVRLVTRLATPSLFEWLWEHAKALLATAGILFAFWLWRIVPRFGVLRPDAPRPRRSLIAHLRAVGRFLWRQRAAAVLLDAARGNVRKRVLQRGLVPPDASESSTAAMLARTFGMHEGDVASALAGMPVNDRQYTAAMATLFDLSRKLNEPAPD